MTFAPEKFKQQFPLFAEPENRELVYLDNAATTQTPQVVIDAVANFYRTSNANAHRASHRLGRKATELVEGTRQLAAQFLNAASAEEIVFTNGTTGGLNLLAHSLTQNLQPGDEVVLTTAEHHANLVPWQMAAQRGGLVLKFVPDKNGVPEFDRIAKVLSARTRIVSVTAASNALGFCSDLAVIKNALAQQNIVWVLDAAQLASHRAIDVQAIGCDFLVCSAHKFYGPTGIGLFYGKNSRLVDLPPWQGGGEMIEQVTLQSSQYAPAPHRFEAGTSSLAAIAGLRACLSFWQQQDRLAMAEYEMQLINYLHDQLALLPDIDLLSCAEGNVGIANFTPTESSGLQAVDVAHWLDSSEIAVRAGKHCAMPLMAIHGETLRVSIAAYNSYADIDRLVAAVQECFDHQGVVAETVGDDLESLSIEQLQQLKGWQQRYRQLLKWADAIEAKPHIRNEKNRIRGCESATWLSHRTDADRHWFLIDSDARVVKGLAALLLVLVNGKTTAEITALDLQAVFSKLGLDAHLSPSRSNGFRALVDSALELVIREN